MQYCTSLYAITTQSKSEKQKTTNKKEKRTKRTCLTAQRNVPAVLEVNAVDEAIWACLHADKPCTAQQNARELREVRLAWCVCAAAAAVAVAVAVQSW
eukprot:9263-Heterococcus_DN1.PRE.3